MSCVGLKVTCAVEGTGLVPIPRRSIDFVNLTDLRGAGLRFLLERLRVSDKYQYVSILKSIQISTQVFKRSIRERDR